MLSSRGCPTREPRATAGRSGSVGIGVARRAKTEPRTLDVGKLPLSCAFVLRAVVELAVNDYMDANSLPRGEKRSQREFELTKKADHVLKHIASSGSVSSSDLRPFRRNMLHKSSACSIQSLNGFVHGPYDLPKADALRAGWESVVPVLTATYGEA